MGGGLPQKKRGEKKRGERGRRERGKITRKETPAKSFFTLEHALP